MTSLEAYHNFLLKVNKNDSNANVHISVGKFVSIFNEEAEEWLADSIDKDIDSDDQNDLQELLVDEKKLEVDRVKTNFVDFKLPEDFFYLLTSYSIAKKGNCKGRILENWNIKNKEARILLTDENNKPSFEFEETLLKVHDDKVKVYKDDFDIEEAYISYYREPAKIDVSGYIRADGKQSTTKNPDISDYLVNKIIGRCALEAVTNTQDTAAFQFAQARMKLEQ